MSLTYTDGFCGAGGSLIGLTARGITILGEPAEDWYQSSTGLALKKSLVATAGLKPGAVVRGSPKRSKAEPVTEEADEVAAPSLFDLVETR